MGVRQAGRIVFGNWAVQEVPEQPKLESKDQADASAAALQKCLPWEMDSGSMKNSCQTGINGIIYIL